MNRAEIESKVKKAIFKVTGINKVEIQPDELLISYDIEFTSINFLRLIVELEAELGVIFDDDELSLVTLRTLDDIVNSVE